MTEIRLQQIAREMQGDHARLKSDDRCYFLHEYTSNRGYTFGRVNQLIANLKKPVDRRGRNGYAYKEQAIRECSAALTRGLNDNWLSAGTLVPVPPSKAKDHPLYDDRLLRILNGITKQFPINVREMVIQTKTTLAAHEAGLGGRPTLHKLLDIYELNPDALDPAPVNIAIFDDVLTAGTHFRAMKTVLSRKFPGVPISGIFIARRIFPNDDGGPFGE